MDPSMTRHLGGVTVEFGERGLLGADHPASVG